MRLFVAIALPQDIRLRLSLLQGGVPGARWVPVENFHLTLVFVGEVDLGRARDIDDALSSVSAAPFELSLSGCGVFGGKDPRSLWIGVKPSPPLMIMQGRIEAALKRFGFSVEDRRFQPHVTIARLKDANRDKLGQFIAAHNLFDSGPLGVAAFTLFESHMGARGSQYQPLSEYPLQP